MPTVLVSCVRLWLWKREPKAPNVPVTTVQQSEAARLALWPSGYVLSFVAGSNPQIQRPCTRIVRRGPSVTVWPPRSTVTVIGRPWLLRMRCETDSNVVASLPFTATTWSPAWSPAAAAGVCALTAATSLLGCELGAGRVDRGEDEERDEHVRERPGGDDRDALPGRLPPVRVGAGPLLDVTQCAVRRASCGLAQVDGLHVLLKLR